MQSVALTSVVRRDIEQTRLQELRLLHGAVERGDQDGLATAALAEHRDVLLKHSVELHVRNVLITGGQCSAVVEPTLATLLI